MPYKDREKQKEFQRKWRAAKTAKLKAAEDQTEYKAFLKKRRESRLKYNKTKKGKAARERRWDTGAKQKADKKYAQSLRGRILRRAQHDKYRYGEYSKAAYTLRMLKRKLYTEKLKGKEDGKDES